MGCGVSRVAAGPGAGAGGDVLMPALPNANDMVKVSPKHAAPQPDGANNQQQDQQQQESPPRTPVPQQQEQNQADSHAPSPTVSPVTPHSTILAGNTPTDAKRLASHTSSQSPAAIGTNHDGTASASGGPDPGAPTRQTSLSLHQSDESRERNGSATSTSSAVVASPALLPSPPSNSPPSHLPPLPAPQPRHPNQDAAATTTAAPAPSKSTPPTLSSSTSSSSPAMSGTPNNTSTTTTAAAGPPLHRVRTLGRRASFGVGLLVPVASEHSWMTPRHASELIAAQQAEDPTAFRDHLAIYWRLEQMPIPPTHLDTSPKQRKSPRIAAMEKNEKHDAESTIPAPSPSPSPPTTSPDNRPPDQCFYYLSIGPSSGAGEKLGSSELRPTKQSVTFHPMILPYFACNGGDPNFSIQVQVWQKRVVTPPSNGTVSGNTTTVGGGSGDALSPLQLLCPAPILTLVGYVDVTVSQLLNSFKHRQGLLLKRAPLSALGGQKQVELNGSMLVVDYASIYCHTTLAVLSGSSRWPSALSSPTTDCLWRSQIHAIKLSIPRNCPHPNAIQGSISPMNGGLLTSPGASSYMAPQGVCFFQIWRLEDPRPRSSKRPLSRVTTQTSTIGAPSVLEVDSPEVTSRRSNNELNAKDADVGNSVPPSPIPSPPPAPSHPSPASSPSIPRWVLVHTSEFLGISRNPKFSEFQRPLADICQGDYERPLCIQVMTSHDTFEWEGLQAKINAQIEKEEQEANASVASNAAAAAESNGARAPPPLSIQPISGVIDPAATLHAAVRADSDDAISAAIADDAQQQQQQQPPKSKSICSLVQSFATMRRLLAGKTKLKLHPPVRAPISPSLALGGSHPHAHVHGHNAWSTPTMGWRTAQPSPVHRSQPSPPTLQSNMGTSSPGGDDNGANGDNNGGSSRVSWGLGVGLGAVDGPQGPHPARPDLRRASTTPFSFARADKGTGAGAGAASSTGAGGTGAATDGSTTQRATQPTDEFQLPPTVSCPSPSISSSSPSMGPLSLSAHHGVLTFNISQIFSSRASLEALARGKLAAYHAFHNPTSTTGEPTSLSDGFDQAGISLSNAFLASLLPVSKRRGSHIGGPGSWRGSGAMGQQVSQSAGASVGGSSGADGVFAAGMSAASSASTTGATSGPSSSSSSHSRRMPIRRSKTHGSSLSMSHIPSPFHHPPKHDPISITGHSSGSGSMLEELGLVADPSNRRGGSGAGHRHTSSMAASNSKIPPTIVAALTGCARSRNSM